MPPGMGAYITAGFHLGGLVASFSMGSLSDRLGRGRVILVIGRHQHVVLLCFRMDHRAALLRDCHDGNLLQFRLSWGLSRAFRRADGSGHRLLPGRGFRIEILLGFGAGAISPVVFGAILDWTNPQGAGQTYYAHWGWAFVSLGVPGFAAVLGSPQTVEAWLKGGVICQRTEEGSGFPALSGLLGILTTCTSRGPVVSR